MRPRIKPLAAVLVMVVLAGTSQGQTAEQLKRASELFKQGTANYSSARYDAAIANYNEYLKIRPTVAAGWYNRGLAYKQKAEAAMSRMDFEKAEADFTQAIKLDPKDADFWLHRGHVRSRLVPVDFANKLPQAIADYTQVIKLRPNASEGYTGRGRMYEESNQSEKALADLNKALQLNPRDYVAYFTRGKVHGLSKNYAAARSDLEYAIRLFPDYAAAKSLLEYINREGQKSGVSSPVTATSKAPTASEALISDAQSGYKLADEAEKRGDHAAVISLVTRTLPMIPLAAEWQPRDDLMTFPYLALVKMRARALAALRRDTEADKDYSVHGMAAIRTISRYMKASSTQLMADNTVSGSGTIMARLESSKAVITCKSGLEVANEWSDLVKRTRPNDNKTLLGSAIAIAGLRETCSYAYRMHASNQLGGITYDRGDKAKYLNDAIASLTEAIRLFPGEPKTYLERAKAYRELGRPDLAVADEQKSRELPTPK